MRLYCQDRAQDPPLWTLFPDNIKSFSLSEALSKSLSHTHSLNLSLSLSLSPRGSQWGPASASRLGVCCFVLLEPTWMLYRVPRVSPGVTAPILRSPPSRATPGPPLPYRPLQSARLLLSGAHSGVQHLLGLIRGLCQEDSQSETRDPHFFRSGLWSLESVLSPLSR